MKKKKKKFHFFKFLMVLIFIGGASLGLFYFKESKSFLENVSKDDFATLSYYAIYGTHLNLKGNFDLAGSSTLVLTDGENEYPIDLDVSGDYFETSDLINGGINLEKLSLGNFYLLFKYEKDDSIQYYSLKNETDYGNLTYYSLTKNGKNNKIDFKFKGDFLNVLVKESSLPSDVYDITIDPGHDANDSGMMVCLGGELPSASGKCKNGTLYKETDLNLALALEVKKNLEDLGYKVIMTRNNEKDTVCTYCSMGSATMANDTKSKFNLALHHNSTGVVGAKSHGLEVYVANDIDFDLANLFSENIVKYANTSVSLKKDFLVSNGVYQRFFTKKEIDESDEKFPLKTPFTIYYYAVREVGGISTHAYNDGRYSKYPKNEHYNSNNTAESYLLELGYMDNKSDLNNILSNRSGYAKGISEALRIYLSEWCLTFLISDFFWFSC